MAVDTGRLRIFTYVNVDHAPFYRAVMRAFTDAKERFGLHLRPADVETALATAELPDTPDRPSLESLLQQLCEWGNLERYPDTAEVATVEEFYRPRFLYQLSWLRFARFCFAPPSDGKRMTYKSLTR